LLNAINHVILQRFRDFIDDYSPRYFLIFKPIIP
jgi:hypothetical protein